MGIFALRGETQTVRLLDPLPRDENNPWVIPAESQVAISRTFSTRGGGSLRTPNCTMREFTTCATASLSGIEKAAPEAALFDS